MLRNVSVQRRLTAMVVIQAISAAVLLVLALSTMARLVSHSRYTNRFILEPLAEIGTALEDSARVTSASDVHGVVERTSRFVRRYRRYWQLSGSTNPDAMRQVRELRHAHATWLVDEERTVVDELAAAVERLDQSAQPPESPDVVTGKAAAERAALYRLMDINIHFAAIARHRSEDLARQTAWIMALVGLAAIAASTLFGFRVRRAIVPRIRQLVSKVRRFQEFGVNEPTPHPERDELTILSHALDVGFAAIAARDRDRDHFLAVMAHELKTPLANIHGFAQTALSYPERVEVRTRAIAIIARHANRLVRLVEDLLLVSRAHASELPFSPAPMQLTPLVEQIAAEVAGHEPGGGIHVEAEGPAPVLADQALLSHALWTMLTWAVGRAGPNAVRVRVTADDEEAVTLIDGFGPPFTDEELARLFEPFSSVGYESAAVGQRRNVLGLYLCREIAKAHGGAVRAFNRDGGPALALSIAR